MPFKTTVNWLFNDIWYYSVIGRFDWKISVSQQTVVRVYYILNGSNHTKCVSLNNQKCITLINLRPNECNQELHYCPFVIKLDRSVGSCDSLNDLSNNLCVKNKTEDLNLSVFNMAKGIDEWKTLTKHVSCECKCKFDGRNSNSNQKWNNYKCRCECKKHHTCRKYYIWNPATYSCENGKYLTSIIDNSVITCGEIIDANAEARSYNEEIKAVAIYFNGNVKLVKHKISIFYLHFY